MGETTGLAVVFNWGAPLAEQKLQWKCPTFPCQRGDESPRVLPAEFCYLGAGDEGVVDAKGAVCEAETWCGSAHVFTIIDR